MNKWDREFEQLMKSSKSQCQSFMQCHIECSPEVGIWLRRRWLLARVKKYINGDLCDPRNLFGDCKKVSMNIKDPHHITREELQCEMMVTSRNIEAPRKKAPSYDVNTSKICIAEQ